jgi:hypothetical protein
MSIIESINISIKINGKVIDVTYEGWIEIHELIHEYNMCWFIGICILSKSWSAPFHPSEYQE